MHRFFVPPDLVKSESSPFISLPKELAHQVRDVLRLVVGEQLVLLDNTGDEVLASVASSSKVGVEVQLLERRAGKSESSVRIILCQGLLKSARFEWILEKGTELGVAAFAPILCRRSMAGLEDAGPSKLQRWLRIIQEATEQCGRSRLPELLPIRPLIHALNDIPPGATALMPWEEEQGQSLQEVLRCNRGGLASYTFGNAAPLRPPETPLSRLPFGSSGGAASRSRSSQREEVFIAPKTDVPITVVLFIGPEGGLMAEEVKLAQRYGVQTVTLGPRILRAETAASTAIANVMYELE
jgi:16S rRNA (uracil1498-N3)-methyltransferase